jgi:hypothetical protein
MIKNILIIGDSLGAKRLNGYLYKNLSILYQTEYDMLKR